MSGSGKIHIYCGNGKGKTTASIGLAIRAYGSGMRVMFAQFLKDNTSSEIGVLKSIGEGFVVAEGEGVEKFVFNMSKEEFEHTANSQNKKLSACIKLKGEFDLIILDEILGAIETKIIDENTVLEFLKNKPENLEVVLTGRNPSKNIVAMADYISDINMVKHPFESGLQARKGIEY